MSSNNATGNFDLDHAYLRATVAAPLTSAMAQLAILQPEDPIEFLGNYLLKFVAHELETQRVVELKRSQQRTNTPTTETQLHSGANNIGKAVQDAQNDLAQVGSLLLREGVCFVACRPDCVGVLILFTTTVYM